MSTERVQQLEAKLQGRSPGEALALLDREDPGKVVFSTSFGYEDQVLTHLIFSAGLNIRVFTLDTGRLFPETYSVWNSTLERYNQPIHAYFPNEQKIEALVREKGPNSFYASVENRIECCQIRKVEPLRRALKGHTIWITGIRKEQSAGRHGMGPLEWDAVNGIVKFHPLYDWSFDQVREFIRLNNIPYNPLHDKGFPSIGCQPCTRAIREGEDLRAGRWWWEQNDKKECGLHLK